MLPDSSKPVSDKTRTVHSFLANNEALIAYNHDVRHAHAHNEQRFNEGNYLERIDSFDETANSYYTYDDDPS